MKVKKYLALNQKINSTLIQGKKANQKLLSQYEMAHEYYSEIQNWNQSRNENQLHLDINSYCCLEMVYHLIEEKSNLVIEEINYDSIITEKDKDFGIPIHDGGSSYIKIKYCPWCGKKL